MSNVPYEMAKMAGGRGAEWGKYKHAAVYFWDHVRFAPGVILVDVGDGLRKTLGRSITRSKRAKNDIPPGRAAVHLVTEALERGLKVDLINAPVGATTGQTFGRLTSEAHAIGGCGTIIVDIEMGEVIVFGGFGFNFAEDFNPGAKRTYTLEDLKIQPEVRAVAQRREPDTGRSTDKKKRGKPKKAMPKNDARAGAPDEFSSFMPEVEDADAEG